MKTYLDIHGYVDGLTAAHIPRARFVVLDSKNRVLMQNEPAWSYFWNEFYRFLGINSESLVQTGKTPSSTKEIILLELSARERDVLRLLGSGLNNMEIARKLTLREKTVRNYISNIYAKLQVNSR